MGKLHEILAVEGSRRGGFEKLLAETKHIFKDRADLFRGEIRTYHPYSEDDANEAGEVERLDLTTTVAQRIEYLMEGAFTDYVDVVFQKEDTNRMASANIEIDDRILASGVPVTFLLNLEKNLSSLRGALNQAPTHQSGVDWESDVDHAVPGVSKAKSDEKAFRTKKILRPFEMSPATKEHKAQVEKLTEDKIVGEFIKQRWSGMMTPADKSAMMHRLDRLIEAVRAARMRANEIDVLPTKVARGIVDFIVTG